MAEACQSEFASRAGFRAPNGWAEENSYQELVPKVVKPVRTLGKCIEYIHFEGVASEPGRRLAIEYIEEDHVVELEGQVTIHSSLGGKD